MVVMVLLTVLSLPFALLAARVGRRRWVRRTGAVGLAAFHHRLTRS
ncbi:hypothetical protein AB0I60_12430 [Actinosynnema sp. NPDC050436]